MQHRISAGVIIQQEARLLLVRHVVQGKYDFWVCPGGGVKGSESLEEAACREAKEETGLDVQVTKLVYFEEFFNPDCRFLKFWFLAHPMSGELNVSHPDTVAEHIVEAAWLRQDELRGRTVFPSVIVQRFREDAAAGFKEIVRLPLRAMDVW
jgi:8-oxo-dGTP diphosphatase